MDRVVARPPLPQLGLEPRYLRQRRMPAIADEIATQPPPGSFDGAGHRVDEATHDLRQRIVAAKPLAARRLPASLATSIAAGLAALRLGSA